MKKPIRKNVSAILAALMLTALLAGCNNSGSEPNISDLSDSESSDSFSSSSTSSSSSSVSGSTSSDSSSESSYDSNSAENSDNTTESSPDSDTSTSSESSSSTTTSSYSSGTPANVVSGHGDSAMAVIPRAEQTARVEGERISFTVDNVFSEGVYYTIKISGVKMANQSAGITNDTTYINGVLYGDFRLDLYKMGSLIDTLKINVPQDDSFLILENAAIGKDYGFTLLSHKEQFSDESYPDMVRLDFFRQRGMAVPQYARYFAVFDGKLDEIRFYQNGYEVAPIGTHVKMRGEGLLTQNLTVQDGRGGYTVIKYEYRLDLKKRIFNRTQVRFTGWED